MEVNVVDSALKREQEIRANRKQLEEGLYW